MEAITGRFRLDFIGKMSHRACPQNTNVPVFYKRAVERAVFRREVAVSICRS